MGLCIWAADLLKQRRGFEVVAGRLWRWQYWRPSTGVHSAKGLVPAANSVP